MGYKLTKNDGIIRLTDGAVIPRDLANSDYQEFLTWFEAGNEPQPVDPPTPEEIAAEVEHARTVADTHEAKTYAKLTALKGMTPVQIQTWMTNNVTNLAQARDALTTLAIAVSILARRL